MARIRVRIDGADRLARRLRALPEQIEAAAAEAVAEGAEMVRADAQRRIREGAKTGRDYEKYGPRRTHRAAAPGEAPADDTGALADGIRVVMDADGLGATVESRAPYSKFLEFGTRTMAARPFLFPALEANRAAIRRLFREKIHGALKGARGKS